MAKAMVKPVPQVSSPAKPESYQLERVLKLIGNDRAYTLIRNEGLLWVIHFDGDLNNTLITIEEGKPKIN